MFTHFLRKFRFNFILVSFNFIRKMRNKCVNNLSEGVSFFLIFAHDVRPEVAEAIIQPSEEVSESAVPSAVA